jgi:DNA transposition AAA+ family ATPase
MNKETKDLIIESLNAYMKTHELSANQVASQAEVNPSYLSQMRAGKYTVKAGDKEVEIADKWYNKLAEYSGFELTKAYWGTRKTPQFVKIIAALEDAKKYGNTAVIIGETGAGKSYTAGMYVKAHPLDTWIVKVGSSDNLSDLLNKALDELDIAAGFSKAKRIKDMIRTLKARQQNGQKPMIIFDESEYMKLSGLWVIKELYDNLEGIASIVMLGTDQLIANIDKLRRRNKSGIPQLYRRIKFGIRVIPPIDRSYKLFLENLEPGLKRFLMSNCDNYGELHDVLVPAMREADRIGLPLTENLVRTILNMPK